MEISTLDGIIRLCVALMLGGVIGYERQAQNKAAGLRTHVLVCVGACLCMIISINIAMEYFSVYGYRNSDPERIAAQVVSGVGFLGAGTILANQKGRVIHGLTTAAGLWAVAAIGLVVGAGYLMLAVVSTALIFIVLTVFIRLDHRLRGQCRRFSICVVMKNTVVQSRRLRNYLDSQHLTVERFHIESGDEDPVVTLHLTVTAAQYMDEHTLIGGLLGVKGVTMTELAADSKT